MRAASKHDEGKGGGLQGGGFRKFKVMMGSLSERRKAQGPRRFVDEKKFKGSPAKTRSSFREGKKGKGGAPQDRRGRQRFNPKEIEEGKGLPGT